MRVLGASLVLVADSYPLYVLDNMEAASLVRDLLMDPYQMIAIRLGSTLIALLLLTACDGGISQGHATGLNAGELSSVRGISSLSDRQLSPKNSGKTAADSDDDASDQHLGSRDARIRNLHVCSVNLWHRECNWGLLFTEIVSGQKAPSGS